MIGTLEEVRARAEIFCHERDWTQFHTPNNLMLALTGEVGELCECFQWKNQLQPHEIADKFSEEEIIHIGEEIADVMIYSIRLADIIGVDLAAAV